MVVAWVGVQEATFALSPQFSFFFLMIRRPPRSTLFPTRRSSDLRPARPRRRRRRTNRSRSGSRSGPSRAGRGRRSEETRLNSSHSSISYAVFCLKKKNVESPHSPPHGPPPPRAPLTVTYYPQRPH